MVYAAALNREQFVGWLGNTFEPSPRKYAARQLPDVQGGDLVLIWNEKADVSASGPRRPLIGISSYEFRDFFSFVSTYVGTFQPFTAFFRVAPIELLANLVDRDRVLERNNALKQLLGVIIAEARMQVGERIRQPSDLSIQACLATLSASAVAGIAAGLRPNDIDLTLKNWMKTRRLIAQEPLRFDFGILKQFWDTVIVVYEGFHSHDIALDEPMHKITQFVGEVMSLPDDADPGAWFLLTQDLPVTRAALTSMRESREDRVRALDDVTKEIGSTEAVDRQIREVLAGYLASRVAAGSFQYLQLLQPLESRLPVSPLWFGLFSSLRSDTDVMIAGECLGRRVTRHVEAHHNLFDAPVADVSVDELEILLPTPKSELKFRTEHQGSVAVEVFPAIDAVFRAPREARRDPDQSTNLSREGIAEIRTYLKIA